VGLWLNYVFSRYVIPEDSPIKDFEDKRYRGSRDQEYGFPITALGNDSKVSSLVLWRMEGLFLCIKTKKIKN
jgi:hypothetical protein